ncbi:flagellar motor protein MotB [Psychromonas sp. Urea-02u-13]|uniref:flagellar motor protein MotB n=1 Tax=Psychromonas sp. Urea-02u-13 TaxID=2058326 RepID=UPI000C34D3E7|nr:flagellar motor protein MotB [Psychromonas sp. Urea-02u-13]PKG40842.1 flagellar motor protein MotB [Psychromonas sp. Urea-02u-13]
MSSASIIISKKKRLGKHDSHSSAWKLAFADLMVCLMCVFLVLWALEVANKEEKEKIIEYFQTGDDAFLTPNSLSPVELLSYNKDHNTDTRATKNTSLIQGEYNTQEELQLLMRKMTEYVKEIGAEQHIFVQVIPDGLRIVLADSTKHKMFKLGESDLTPFYKKMLLKFSLIFNNIENGIAISGHTDALQFKGFSKSNWELSTQRANEARATMESGGLQSENIVQVLGLANTKPLDAIDLTSSVNRRVEVILLARTAKDKLNAMHSMNNAKLKLDINSSNSAVSDVVIK